jgi:DHA1 family bicyclomycin/chloramphenicol resistance-like MFS transporter
VSRAGVTLSLVVAGSLLGLMGTDLVLPAVPHFPEALGGTVATAQLVIAAYVGGSCVGLLVFGALGSRMSTARLIAGSLIGTAALSLACALVTSLDGLIVLRALQGAVSSGPAVFVPALVKRMLDEARAVRAMGLIGSIQSLAPALAPIAGVALLSVGTWRTTFLVLAALAGILVLLLALTGGVPHVSRRAAGSYSRLVTDPVFLRYALSHALILGGLLTFVFALPAVFVRVHHGSVTDFIVVQVVGITTFIVAANLADRAVARFGTEPMILFGTCLAAAGTTGQCAYALGGGHQVGIVAALAVPMNVGLGLRGPPGFIRAIVAARGDDARASAVVIVAILTAAALGTTLVSPWIDRGLLPVAGAALAMHLSAVLCLRGLPALQFKALQSPWVLNDSSREG